MQIIKTIDNAFTSVWNTSRDVIKGDLKLDIHLPFSFRELTEEEQQAKIQAELERRAKATKAAQPPRLEDMSDDELKAMQARIHKNLDDRKKAKAKTKGE